MSRHRTMVSRAKEYLAHRRTLGFALDSAGKLLLQFARFVDRTKHRGPLTTDLALRWASLSRGKPRDKWATDDYNSLYDNWLPVR